jgi:hypothetical protein
MARLGSYDSFEIGRQVLRIYSGIEVGAKDVERISEAIGAAILHQEAVERPALLNQRPTPAIAECIPIMYIQCDGTGVPMITKELAGRKGKSVPDDLKEQWDTTEATISTNPSSKTLKNNTGSKSIMTPLPPTRTCM